MKKELIDTINWYCKEEGLGWEMQEGKGVDTDVPEEGDVYIVLFTFSMGSQEMRLQAKGHTENEAWISLMRSLAYCGVKTMWEDKIEKIN